MTEAKLSDAGVLKLLKRAPFAHLAVETSGGPHVTPLLFAATDDRLWLAVSERTVKARVLARRPRVGVLIRKGAAAAAIRGEATLLDPSRPAAVAARPGEALRAPFGLPSYALRNAAELLGFIRDAHNVPSDSMPGNLVLVSVRPNHLMLVRGERLAASAGTRGVARALRAALEGVPEDVAALARSPSAAVLGLLTPEGPAALPATWQPQRATARVAAAALADAGAPAEAPAAVCIDATEGSGPTAKRGVMLRGHGRVSPNARGGTVTVAFEPERVTYWRGFETRTVPQR